MKLNMKHIKTCLRKQNADLKKNFYSSQKIIEYESNIKNN